VLHSLSFVDDPTRILRAVRLEQRLGFIIEPRTAELIDTALPMLDRVTGDRIRSEIELALTEPDPVPIMERMAQLHIMEHIHPALTWSAQTADAFARLPQLLADPLWQEALSGETPAFIYFAVWLAPLTAEEQRRVMVRLKVRKATREDVEAVSELLGVLDELPAGARPSRVEKALRPYRPRVLLVARVVLAETDAAVAQLERYYREWRFVKTVVTGDDLRAMGLKPGPQYAVLLDRLLAARLDGEVSDEAGERALLAQWIEADQ
jgi:tRNA nucleotidyltransferase (CCA-adding enzyme)